VMAAPAVRIGVIDVLRGEKRTVLFEDFDNEWIAFPHGLAEQLRGQISGFAFDFEKAAGRIDRAIDRQAVLLADHVILLAMAGGGMDGAGALLERYVIAENTNRSAVDEGMAESCAFEFIAVETGDDDAARPAAYRRRRCKRLR